MISLRELRERQREMGIALEVLEKDYCLGWLLKGLADSPLSDQMVFKGGTALRKLYFSEYRFSEDLDFTLTAEQTAGTLQQELSAACGRATAESGIRFTLAALEQTRAVPQETAWQGRVAFIGPRQQTHLPRRIRLDLTAYEQVLLPPARRPLLHTYSDTFEALVPVYAPEEILAEKLRTLLQRGYPRDIYDTWYLLTQGRLQLNLECVAEVFRHKCAYKRVAFTSVDNFRTAIETQNTEAHWQASLGAQIRFLPVFTQVLEELYTAIDLILS